MFHVQVDMLLCINGMLLCINGMLGFRYAACTMRMPLAPCAVAADVNKRDFGASVITRSKRRKKRIEF